MTFETFYMEHADRVLRVLRNKLPACYVEDAAQEVWHRVALHFETSKPTAQWVNRIMATVTASIHRKEHRRRDIREFLPLSLVGEAGAVDATDLTEKIIEDERYEAIRTVYSASTPSQRHNVAGYIQALGIKRVTPAQRVAMHRFRKTLREAEQGKQLQEVVS